MPITIQNAHQLLASSFYVHIFLNMLEVAGVFPMCMAPNKICKNGNYFQIHFKTKSSSASVKLDFSEEREQESRSTTTREREPERERHI